MLNTSPTLHCVCGKIAAGKSTLARRLASEQAAILLNEDVWLSGLYPDEISTIKDYVKYSARLRDVMAPHVVNLLHAGQSVVLDFPANTVALRHWIRAIVEDAGANHELHYLDVSDAICKARLQLRNEKGGHEFAPSVADYDLISSYFVPPSPDEGFNVSVYQEG